MLSKIYIITANVFMILDYRFMQDKNYIVFSELSQPAFTCSKLTIEIIEQGVKYVQS